MGLLSGFNKGGTMDVCKNVYGCIHRNIVKRNVQGFTFLLCIFASFNLGAMEELSFLESVLPFSDDAFKVTRAQCENPQLAGNVSEILGRVQKIQNQVNLIQTEVLPLGPQIATMQAILCSKIENIDFSFTGTLVIDNTLVLVEVSLLGETLCSKLEQISNQTSFNDALILTAIDGIQCSATDLGPILLEISLSDAMLCSKIGSLDAEGTCLDSFITVPQDVNNLNLTIIALLKTILLELRGCNC